MSGIDIEYFSYLPIEIDTSTMAFGQVKYYFSTKRSSAMAIGVPDKVRILENDLLKWRTSMEAGKTVFHDRERAETNNNTKTSNNEDWKKI